MKNEREIKNEILQNYQPGLDRGGKCTELNLLGQVSGHFVETLHDPDNRDNTISYCEGCHRYTQSMPPATCIEFESLDTETRNRVYSFAHGAPHATSCPEADHIYTAFEREQKWGNSQEFICIICGHTAPGKINGTWVNKQTDKLQSAENYRRDMETD